MKTEYEVRILEIDIESVTKKLNELNAEYIGEFNQKRYVYDLIPKQDDKWIRLRSNGKKTELTIKQIKDSTIDGTKELETEVADFDTTHAILRELGFREKAFQENKRISYKLNGVNIDIDTWPLIPTYMEIEGKSIEEVESIISLLNIPREKVTALGNQSIYLDIYNIDIEKIEYLKFAD